MRALLVSRAADHVLTVCDKQVIQSRLTQTVEVCAYKVCVMLELESKIMTEYPSVGGLSLVTSDCVDLNDAVKDGRLVMMLLLS